MSFLDMDERLLELAKLIDVVYSPLVDAKDFPDEVDIALVEGAVASEDDEKKIKKVRAHSKMLIAMGDCAVAGNVPSMRNPFGPEAILNRAYIENASAQQQIPCVVVPKLLKVVRPIHEFVTVDVFLPGCPPSADTFHTALTALATARSPSSSTARARWRTRIFMSRRCVALKSSLKAGRFMRCPASRRVSAASARFRICWPQPKPAKPSCRSAFLIPLRNSGGC
jgi:NAD-reducing hydrogenase small subunit